VRLSIKIGLALLAAAAATARTFLQLGRALGTAILAEGVETERQAEFLLAEGCDQLQGFLLAKPLPVEAVLALLAAPDASGERAATAPSPVLDCPPRVTAAREPG
jgi:sensor c-di-GMP phosphodiesterase-like protein